MLGVIPPDQGEARTGEKQAVDRRIAQLPGAGRAQVDPGGGPVQAVEHPAVGNPGHAGAGMLARQPLGGVQAPGLELDQGLAARRRELRIAGPPAAGPVRMVLVDLLSAAVYAGDGAQIDKEGRAVFALEPRLLFDLLAGADAGKARAEERLSLPKPTASTVEDLRREIEVSLYRQAFHAAEGDFSRMSEILLGTAKEERAVRLRFNKLGLSAREER